MDNFINEEFDQIAFQKSFKSLKVKFLVVQNWILYKSLTTLTGLKIYTAQAPLFIDCKQCHNSCY